MGYLYQLIPNAFTILSDSYAKIGEIGFEAATITNSPKQPVLENQLIHCSSLFYLVDSLIVLNDDGTAIIGINADADLINALLLQLRDACGLNTLSQFPTPLTTLDFNTVNGSTYPVGGLGALLQSTGATYLPLEMGASGTVLTASPTGLVWSAVVGNGIPSGGTTGQYLEKIDNTSYNVQWATLTVSKITDITATAAEINILDGVVGVSPAEISYLSGVTSDIQTQFTGKLSTALADGQIFIGNGSGVATGVTPSGVIGLTNTGVFSIVNDSIVDADINSAAAITRSKLASGTANRIVINSSIGVMTDAAVINPSVVLVSDANGIPTHSATATATLGYLDISSSLQASLDERLVVNLTSVAQGDVLVYNGTDWINLAVGTVGQVLQSNGTTVVWGSAATNGLPTGGTANQILRKIDGTDYNTEWHTFVLADVTDVSTTFTELNLLSGLTVSSSVINFLSGANANIQDQINAKLDNNLAYHAIYVGGPGATALQVSPGTDGSILTIVSGHPTWQTPPAPGNVSGPVSSTDNALVRWNLTSGDSIQDSGIIIDDSNNMTFPTGTSIRTGTSAGNTLLLQAYDVNGTAYTTFGTLTANNTPTFDLSTDVTIGTSYIYRVGGTDVAVADGGTNISSYTAGDILYATGATTLAKLPISTDGFVLTLVAGLPAWVVSGGGGGGGTVTDFSAGTLSPLFTTSVATSTSTPALSFALTNAGANTYFGNATGSPAAPSYTSAAALTKTDDANITLTLGGGHATALLTAASLTLGWTGTLAVARGGTGLNSLGTALQLIRVNAGATAIEYFTPTFISGNETITLSGEASGSGATSIAVTLSNSSVIGKVLTGFTSGAGTVSATDTILQAIQKLDGNDGTKWSLASGGTLTGANTLTGTTTNTLKYVFNSLGVTQTNGAGFWLANNTAATSGNQQESPSIVLEGQGFATGVAASQSNKWVIRNVPVQGSLLNSSLLFQNSVNNVAYSTAFTLTGSGPSAPTYGLTSGASISSPLNTMIIQAANAASPGIQFNHTFSTAGTNSISIAFSMGFNPASGSNTWKATSWNGVVNQTGGANGQVTIMSIEPTYTSAGGNVTFLNYNPTITSISGTHYGIIITPACLNGLGVTPTAMLHVGAGAATRAPFKLTSGTNLTTAETGSVEYDGTNLFFTRTGTTRENVLVGNDSAAAPGTNTVGIIVDYYGTSATRVLTTPTSWASVVINGTTYKIPLYA
jgi:hypothetical protein